MRGLSVRLSVVGITALLLSLAACETAASDRSPGPSTAPVATTAPAVERLCPRANLDTVRVLDCLDAGLASFWTQQGVDVGAQTFVYYAIPSSMPSAGCTRLLSLRSWFRCVDDDAVYLSGEMLERDRDLFGVDIGLAMAFVVAEEFGLAIQEVRGQPGVDLPVPESRWVTIVADCLAGVWAAYEQSQDRLEVADLRAVIDQELTAGYEVPVPTTLPGFEPELAYGSVADRLSAFDQGTASGRASGCGSG